MVKSKSKKIKQNYFLNVITALFIALVGYIVAVMPMVGDHTPQEGFVGAVIIFIATLAIIIVKEKYLSD